MPKYIITYLHENLTMFISYSPLEVRIFKTIRIYFEKLPPLDSDDYDNAFYDLVAQYGAGGQEYDLINILYDDLINSTILEKYSELSGTDKKDMQVFYERNFLENYFDFEKDDFIYTSEDLATAIAGRFKSWIDDNYSIEDLLDENEDEDKEEESENEDEDEENDLDLDGIASDKDST